MGEETRTRRGVPLPRPPAAGCTLSLTFGIGLGCVRDAPFPANTTLPRRRRRRRPRGVGNSTANAPSCLSTVARKDAKSLLRPRRIMKSRFDFMTFSGPFVSRRTGKNRPPWWSNVWFIYAHVIQLVLF